MKIGIIGAGMVARAVGAEAVRHGHEVMLSNSRNPDTLFTLVRTLGVRAGTPQQAAEFGDIVLVAIPLKAYREVPLKPLEGKIVIDANNYYPDRDGQIPELDDGSTTTSELLARFLPKSKVVKAFNAIQAPDVEKEGFLPDTSERRAHPIAGDDQAAKDVVSGLLKEFGFIPVDVGQLAEGRRFERGTPAYCVPLNEAGLRSALAKA
jgi:predicted dinucleotide-binding enzyme